MANELTVLQAINAVRADVTHVEKGDQFDGGRVRYSFRGVDRVVGALAGAVRKHGLLIVPVKVKGPKWVGNVTTSGGTPTNVARLRVTYRIWHWSSMTDYVEVQAAGEAFDTGDKAVSKAMSVAWRTMLLQTFFLPPGDPDPDSENYTMDGARKITEPKLSGRIQQKLADFDLDQEIKGKSYDELGNLYLSLKQQGAPKESLLKVWQAAHGPTVAMPDA